MAWDDRPRLYFFFVHLSGGVRRAPYHPLNPNRGRVWVVLSPPLVFKGGERGKAALSKLAVQIHKCVVHPHKSAHALNRKKKHNTMHKTKYNKTKNKKQSSRTKTTRRKTNRNGNTKKERRRNSHLPLQWERLICWYTPMVFMIHNDLLLLLFFYNILCEIEHARVSTISRHQPRHGLGSCVV